MIFAAAVDSPLEPKPTALYAATASVSIANSWTSVNGWSVPLVYTQLEEEYKSLTETAGMADFGALCRYVVRGEAAVELLARLTTAPLKNIDVGESARGLIVSASGAVVDVVDVSMLATSMYLLTASQPHARRLQLGARGLDVTVEDITGRVAALAIIGPKAREVASAAGVDAASENLAAQSVVRGVETAARPVQIGGQQGIEVVYPYKEALTIWERVRRAGAPTPAGLSALEVLRIENGTPRPGVDFLSADEADADEKKLKSPEGLGLSHLAPLNRAWFNGRRALSDPRASDKNVLRVLAVDAENVTPGAVVFSSGAPAGRITSAAFSPRQRRIVAFADLLVGTEMTTLSVASPDDAKARLDARLLETPEGALAEEFRTHQAEEKSKR